MAFDFSQVSATYLTRYGTDITVLDEYSDVDAAAVATAAGLTNAANPDIELVDDQELVDLIEKAFEMTYFDVSGLPSGFQEDITLALRKANNWGTLSLVDGATTIALADKVGPVYVVASEVEFVLLMAFIDPSFSVVEFGSYTIADDTRAAINGLSDKDTKQVLTLAGVADTTGNRYNVASQAECDAIVAQYFSLLKKKK